MRGRAGVLALLALLALQATAWAEVDLKGAKEHFFKAERLYRVERFADAFTEYQEAYVAKPDPNFLFNMAQCQRLMGNRDEAVRFYRRFLDARPNPPNLAIVQRHLQALEGTRPGAVVVTPPASSLSPPAAVPGAAFVPPPTLTPPAGLRPAAAQGEGERTAPPPLAAPGLPAEALAMAHDEEAPRLIGGAPVKQVADDDRRPIYKKWWFWTAVGAAVVGAVVVGLATHKSDPSCDGLTVCK